jgi:hypothetical protein
LRLCILLFILDIENAQEILDDVFMVAVVFCMITF